MIHLDHDLRRSRRWALCLFAANVVTAALNAYSGQWWIVFGAVIWGIGCILLVRLYESQQRTRDLTRAFEEALLATLSSREETGERYRRWGKA